MKHIVFVVGNYKNGGVAMRATNLANGFAKKGYSSTILVTKEIAEKVFFVHNENVNIVSLNDYVSSHYDDKTVIRNKSRRKLKIRFFKYLRYISKYFPAWDKKLASEIKCLKRTEDISVFISNNPNSVYIPFGLEYFENTFYGAKGIGSKIVYSECNPPELEFPSSYEERERFLKIFAKIDGAVLQTEDELRFFNGILKNAEVIHNPLKTNLPEPFFGERRNVVVNFCRLSAQKNLPLMINAFIKFHKEHPNYTLEIYGNTVEKNEEELKESLKAMISSLNADEFIKILPPRADIHRVVRDCAMFVSSSNFEGLSNSMIEAMAIGLPCICTDCLGGGAREMIEDGVNGLLVPMNDVSALAQAMCRLAEDEGLSKQCSENAAKLRDKLAVETIAGKWLEVIEKII